MKNIYHLGARALLLAAMLFVLPQAWAQTDINWRGGVSTDANDPLNWDPPTGIAGNRLHVGHLGTYTNPANHPVVTGTASFSIMHFTVAGRTFVEPDSVAGGQITFSMPAGTEVHVNNTANVAIHVGGTVIVNSGTMRQRRNLHLDHGSNLARLIVEGTGRATFNDHFGLGNSAGTAGGTAIIRDQGVIHVTHSPGRIFRFSPMSRILISNNGQLLINGDARVHLQPQLDALRIRGGDGFFVSHFFDPVLNQTFYFARPDNTVLAHFTDRVRERTEFLTAGVNGPQVAVDGGSALVGATSFTWRYGTSPTGPFNNVMATSTTTSLLTPNFSAGGTFYLVCEVTTAGGGTVVSNPLVFVVGSANLLLTPGGAQFIRGAQVGAPVTVTPVVGQVESGEWKWSLTPGLNYQSFNPPVTGTTISPDFAAPGVYYIRWEGVVNGQPDVSVEIPVTQLAWDAAAMNITWTGAVNDQFHNPRNWTPIAHPHRNNVIIPVDVPRYPVFSQGVDTIMGGSTIHFQAEVLTDGVVTTPARWAQLIVRGGPTDSLKWRGNVTTMFGELLVESGVFVKDQDLLRLEANSARVTVTGTGTAIFNQWTGQPNPAIAMANAGLTTGGQVHVSGNGRVYFFPAAIFRFAGEPAEFSFFHASDNGQFIFMGDHVAAVAGHVVNRRIRVPANHEVVNLHDPATDLTHVLARDLNSFALAQAGTRFLPVGGNSEMLSLVNTTGLSNFSWKWASRPFGPWQDFTPALAGETASVSFSTTGNYFVVAQAGDGTVTSNRLLFRVIDFAVSVSTVGNVHTLSVNLPTGMTPLGWQKKRSNVTAYAPFELAGATIPYTVDAFDFLEGDGTYHVTYLGAMTDGGVEVNIFAVPVTITIAGGSVASVVPGYNFPTAVGNLGAPVVTVYPNPSTGTFTVNAGVDNYTIEVIDMNGVVVYKRVAVGDGQPVSISRNGVFVVKVTSASGVSINRIVVK